MAAPRFAWGIDIGNRALKAVKLVQSAEGLVIDDFDVVEHETVLSASGDNRDSLVQTALATFVARHPGIDKGQVGVSVNGQRTFAKFIKLPPVEAKKVPEIVKFEAIQQIPFPLDDVEWAYHLFQDPDSPDIEVGIFAMRKELVNAHIAYFTDANLNVQVVQMSPLSVYNAMYYDSRIKGTTMIVDLGAESTDLIIADGESVWLRSIPIGGNNFTEVLSKAFKVDFDKAEELKRNATTSKYSRQIVQHMRPVFADLVSEIQRSMGFYGSVHKESKISRVVALGNTFRLPGLQRYLQQNLTLEVTKLDRLGTSTIEDPRLASLLSENLLSAAGAYGLALQVMGQGKIASSLLPERIRTAKMWREKNKWFAAAAALFVAGAGVAYGSYYFHAGQLGDQANVDYHDNILALEHSASTFSTAWDAVEQAGPSDLTRVNNVRELAQGRGLWPQINSLIYTTLPQFAPDALPGLADGTVNLLKAIPRGERKQIIIAAMTSKYVPDLTGIVGSPNLSQLVDAGIENLPTGAGSMDVGGNAGGAFAGGAFAGNAGANGTAPTGTPTRGFVLTIKCTTPNSNGFQTVGKYLADLKASPATAGRPWVVADFKLVRQQHVRDDAKRMSEMQLAWQNAQKLKQGVGQMGDGGAAGGAGTPEMSDPGAALSGGTGLAAGASAGIPDEAYEDPQLHEDVRNDTEAVVLVVIQLDVQPTPPATTPPPAAPAKAVAVVQ